MGTPYRNSDVSATIALTFGVLFSPLKSLIQQCLDIYSPTSAFIISGAWFLIVHVILDILPLSKLTSRVTSNLVQINRAVAMLIHIGSIDSLISHQSIFYVL